MKLQIKKLKKGKLFKRTADSKKTYIKGDYNRHTQTSLCTACNGYSKELELKGHVLVHA
jgi:hypothetical protein